MLLQLQFDVLTISIIIIQYILDQNIQLNTPFYIYLIAVVCLRKLCTVNKFTAFTLEMHECRSNRILCIKVEHSLNIVHIIVHTVCALSAS